MVARAYSKEISSSAAWPPGLLKEGGGPGHTAPRGQPRPPGTPGGPLSKTTVDPAGGSGGQTEAWAGAARAREQISQ